IDRIDGDHVAVAQQSDRAADRRLRADMTDTETLRRARETPVRDQCDLAAGALAGESCRGREHLAHAGAAPGALVADDEDVAFLVGARLDRLEAGLFAVKAARRAAEF